MNVKQVGNFYIVEQNGKYYLTTIKVEFDGFEDIEYVSGNAISKTVYDLLDSSINIDKEIPSEVCNGVVKEYHSDDEFTPTRRWVFRLNKSLEEQIKFNKHDFETVYNDDEMRTHISQNYNGTIYLSIAEDLYTDLEDSYKSVINKVRFVNDFISKEGYDECDKYLYDNDGIVNI